MEHLKEKYAQDILSGKIDPFEISYLEYQKILQKQQTILMFEEQGDDLSIVKQYLLTQDQEILFDELQDAIDCEDYLNIAESMLFEELDKKMSKIVINKALQVAQSSDDYVAIAELLLEEFDDQTRAKEAYKKALQLATTTIDFLSIADSIKDQDYLHDTNWAMQIYQEALGIAKKFDDFIYIARSVSSISKEDAFDILEVAKNILNNENLKDFVTLANGYSLYVQEKAKAKEFFVKALPLANDFESFFYILNNIAFAQMDKKFFSQVLKITLLATTTKEEQEKVAFLIEKYLEDEKLMIFIKNNSISDVHQFFSKKDQEDYKLAYAQAILEQKIDPQKLTFEDFIKQSDV